MGIVPVRLGKCDIKDHYRSIWGQEPQAFWFDEGRVDTLPKEFRVLRFGPSCRRNAWTYATVHMSTGRDHEIESFILAPRQADELLVRLLFMTASCHQGEQLALGHTIPIGEPWLPGASCDRLLLSLPYLDGPKLEWMKTKKCPRQFLWLIPITERESAYRHEHGLEALEQRFEASHFDYLDPARKSVV